MQPFHQPNFLKHVMDKLHDGLYLVDTQRRITFWNRAAERISGYTADEAVATQCANSLLVHVDSRGTQLCLGNCPLSQTLADGKSREMEVFLHHKKGHRVAVYVHVAPLFDDAGHILGAAELFSDNTARHAMAQENERLKKLALLDVLTEMGNRRYAEEHLDAMISESSRYSWPFGVLFADIDHFKQVNDIYGHAAGDAALKVVAQSLSGGVRAFDNVCRWGGEEFLAIIKHVDAPMLRIVAEKLRMAVEKSTVPSVSPSLRLTVSIGGTVVVPGDSRESVVQRVDSLMYEAKARGRNNVVTG